MYDFSGLMAALRNFAPTNQIPLGSPLADNKFSLGNFVKNLFFETSHIELIFYKQITAEISHERRETPIC